MEEYLANKTIEKVFKVKDGTSQGKKGLFSWVLWDVYIEGGKYRYFSSGNKPVPVVGAFIKMAKYEMKQNEGTGQYVGRVFDNYEIKEMTLGDNLEQQNNEPRQEPDQGPPDDYEPPGEKHGYVDKPTTDKPSAVSTGNEKISFFISYAKDLKVALIEKGEYPEGVTLQECANDVMTVGRDMWEKANG